MRWIGTAGMVVVGMVAWLVVMLAKRSAHGKELGSVSTHWLTEHRVDPS